jgi:hypothetical protein
MIGFHVPNIASASVSLAAGLSLSKLVANPRRGQQEVHVISEPATVTTATLPTCTEPANSDLITSTACLAFLERSALTALEGNLRTLAAAVLYIYAATIWAAKIDRKSMKEVKAILAKVFAEQENPNLNPGRSKRYKFAKLSVEIAAHKDIQPLAVNAAELKSIEAGVTYLAKEFSDRAKSVADLARQFERQRSKLDEAPPTQPFVFLLRALVERAQKRQQAIPFIESVKMLAPAATQQDLLELMKHFIPHTADHAIPELVELLNRVFERRQAKA